jgi:hypothetical protein
MNMAVRIIDVCARHKAGPLAGGLLALVACASTPPAPTQAILAAEQAIAAAEQTHVAEYAAPQLIEARVKLTAAHAAVQAQNMAPAVRLAEQSRVNAELAAAKTETAKAKAVNDQMQKSIDTLKLEMQRNTGAPQ